MSNQCREAASSHGQLLDLCVFLHTYLLHRRHDDNVTTLSRKLPQTATFFCKRISRTRCAQYWRQLEGQETCGRIYDKESHHHNNGRCRTRLHAQYTQRRNEKAKARGVIERESERNTVTRGSRETGRGNCHWQEL
jgi:hypothetical protein